MTRHRSLRHFSRRQQRFIGISIAVLLLIGTLPGTVVATAVRNGRSGVVSFTQDRWNWMSGVLKSRSAKAVQNQRGPRGVKPARELSKAEREERVASIVVSPRQEVTLKSREPITFTGIPVDSQGNAVQGVACEWTSTDKQVIFIRKNGAAMAGMPGTANLVVRAGNKRRIVKVTVVEATTNERFGGKKHEDSSRSAARSVGANATGESKKLVARNGKQKRKLAHSGATSLWRSAPVPMRDPNDDPLPDTETSSLYQPGNLIGNPKGKKKPGAVTIASAVMTSENGNKNFSFGLPVMSLPGRGLDVALGLVYNSLLYNKSTDPSDSSTWLTYDVDSGYPAQGFRLGYGQIEDQGSAGFTLGDADGTRHALVHGTGYEYHSTDGSFIDFVGGSGWGTVYYPGGTIVTYGAAGGGYRSYPTSITDRNGNYVQISYLDNVGPRIDTITDTMGRYVRFYYNSNDELVTITVPGLSSSSELQVMRFYYDDISVGAASSLFNTGSVHVSALPSTIRGIKYIYLPASAEGSSSSDGDTGYRFDYSPYGMIKTITRFKGMTVSSTSTTATGTVTEGTNTIAATTTYDYPDSASSLTDAPTYSHRTDDWAGRTTAAASEYQFEIVEGTSETLSRVTAPDGSIRESVSIKNPGNWDDGLVKEVRNQNIATPSPSPSPTATPVVYARTVIDWQQNSTNGTPRLASVRQTNEAAKTRAIVYSYDSSTPYNNVSVVSERDFSTDGTASNTELRKTETTYVTSSSYLNRHLLHLPSMVKVKIGGTSTTIARVDYEYDNYGSSHANLTPRSDIIMHDPSFDPFAEDEDTYDWVCTHYHYVGDDEVCTNWDWQVVGSYNPYNSSTDYRGNLTGVTTYTDAAGAAGAITHGTTYDIAGNVTTAQVDCCQLKSFTYADTYEYAYPTSVTRGNPSGLHLTSSVTYDFNTGLVATTTDENSQVTEASYYADTLRTSEIDLPDGGVTTYDYADALAADSAGKYHSLLTVSTKLDSTRWVDGKSYFDGRGAVAASFSSYTSGDGWSISNVEYDKMGRAERVSNPYYSTSNYGTVAINSAGIWSTNHFDKLGRVTQVDVPKGDPAYPTYTNSVQTTYAGEVTTVTDQANKQRRQVADALGRIVRLDEPTTSGLGDVSSPNQATYYDYDLLNNLVKITQGSQSRYFMYDSLSRLIRERQVEQETNSSLDLSDPVTSNSSWTKKIVYNSHGLVTQTKDARGIQTDFSYDDLNRLTQTAYSDSTPDAFYYYDSQTLPSGAPSYSHGSANGRLIAMTYGSSSSATGTYLGYDVLGRVNVQKQVTGSNTYGLAYTYNLAGELATETYPTNRVLTHSYDDAGRLAQITDNSSTPITFASSLTYAAGGGLLAETWGNSAYHTVAYNSAMQVSEIKLKQSSAGSELQRFEYHYGQVDQSDGTVDLAKNNGQIGSMDDYIGGTKQFEQRFSYDELGRLANAKEVFGSGFTTNAWQQEFTYDRYGNRFQASPNNTIGLTAVDSSEITASSNRFISTGSTPITYDAAGNITQDKKFRLDFQGNGMDYTYDANGRQLTAKRTDNTGNQTAVYDCTGQRVQTSANNVTRQMVYDIFGQLVEEYRSDATSSGPDHPAPMNGVERENIYRGGQLLAVYEADVCYKSITDFVDAFYAALSISGTTGEKDGWKTALTQLQAQGSGALIGEAQYLGASLFADSRYSNPPSGHTGNLQYVKDLYMAYLQRDPASDTSGWNFWTGVLDGGETRANVRQAFAVSSEFIEGVAKLCPGTSGSTSISGNLKYVLTDAQGSTRLLMENNSTILTRHDYLPFGTDISSGVGSRTTTQKYAVTDRVRQRFAMTERDEASGLDHTLFRKHDSVAGRWTSPDPYSGSMRIGDPQSLNRYSYVQNDPVNLVDPSGLDVCYPDPATGEIVCIPDISEGVDVPISFDEPIDNGSGLIGAMSDDTGMIIVRDPLRTGGAFTGGSSGTAISQNSANRNPCNPTAAQLAQRKEVTNVLEEAFTDSDFKGIFPHEEGAWIFADKNNRIKVVRTLMGTDHDLPDIENIPQEEGFRLVGTLHTHPFVKGEDIASSHGRKKYGPQGQPSESDEEFARTHGNLPGILMTQVGDKRFVIDYTVGNGPNNPCQSF
jgi:RHS repeat-associated protein